MKKINIAYWIVTGLFPLMMLGGGTMDALAVPEGVEMVGTHLGYPTYFIQYIGVAKVLGAIMLLIPGWPRLKEWAYAGFCYDLLGAIWSAISVGDPVSMWLPIILFLGVLFASYALYHKRLKV